MYFALFLFWLTVFVMVGVTLVTSKIEDYRVIVKFLDPIIKFLF